MRRICAWCNAFLGTVEGPADAVTHSICRRCMDEADDPLAFWRGLWTTVEIMFFFVCFGLGAYYAIQLWRAVG